MKEENRKNEKALRALPGQKEACLNLIVMFHMEDLKDLQTLNKSTADTVRKKRIFIICKVYSLLSEVTKQNEFNKDRIRSII